MYVLEWTQWHTTALCAWVVCVAITGTVYALTRNKAALYMLGALLLPLAGALWLRSMLSRGEAVSPDQSPEPEPMPAPDSPPVRIDHEREEALDDLLEEDNTVRDDPPDDLGAALDAWARSGEDG